MKQRLQKMISQRNKLRCCKLVNGNKLLTFVQGIQYNNKPREMLKQQRSMQTKPVLPLLPKLYIYT